MLQRFGTRLGTFGTPSLFQRALNINTPGVDESQVTPVHPGGPQVPISTDNTFTPPSNPLSPNANARVAQGFDVFQPWMPQSSVHAAAQTAAAPAPAPSAPMPQARPSAAPQAPEPMSWFMQNAKMMRDPMTGEFIDPTGAAQAQVSGPQLIQKMMGYLHKKTGEQEA